jgi:hypothetical protein
VKAKVREIVEAKFAGLRSSESEVGELLGRLLDPAGAVGSCSS